MSPDEAARRASRLLRWYPKAWRSRYGEEFAELLIADISERPRSRTRTADVARGGIVARLATAGLCGCTPEASAQVRTSLTALGWCVAIFVGVGTAMWSQLTIGWQWSEPDTAGVAVATFVTSGAMLAFAVLAVLAALRVQVGPERLRSHGREPVRAPPVMALDGLDQPLRLKAGKGLVEGAGRQADAGEGLDVLGQGVAMLGAVRQAGQDERGRARVAAEPGERLGAVRLRLAAGGWSSRHGPHPISATDLSVTDSLSGPGCARSGVTGRARPGQRPRSVRSRL